jgi:hypothetical protein
MRFARLCRNTRIRALLFFCGSLPRSTQNSLPREIPWRELTGIWPPSFARRARCEATGHRGAGTGEPPSSYGAVDRSINSGVPFGKGTGCVNGPVGVRNGTHQRGGRQSSQRILGTVTSSTRDQQVADFGRRFAAHRKGCPGRQAPQLA